MSQFLKEEASLKGKEIIKPKSYLVSPVVDTILATPIKALRGFLKENTFKGAINEVKSAYKQPDVLNEVNRYAKKLPILTSLIEKIVNLFDKKPKNSPLQSPIFTAQTNNNLQSKQKIVVKNNTVSKPNLKDALSKDQAQKLTEALKEKKAPLKLEALDLAVKASQKPKKDKITVVEQLDLAVKLPKKPKEKQATIVDKLDLAVPNKILKKTTLKDFSAPTIAKTKANKPTAKPIVKTTPQVGVKNKKRNFRSI